MSLSASVKLILAATLSKSFDLMAAAPQLRKALAIEFSDGAGANQANRIWHDRRTLAASGTEDLDLSGALVDVFGDAFQLARIKALIVLPAAANTNNVNVSRPAANGVPIFLAGGDGMPVKPGGAFVWVDPSAGGVVVTAGTGDLVTIANAAAGTPVDYDIIVIGAST
jgi:hypothetical protein